MTMPVCKPAIDLVKQCEGLRLTGYLCPAGIPTIGWGHTGPEVRVGQRITEAQAEDLLAADMAGAAAAVDRLVKVPLTPNQRGAIASFTLNLGAGSLGSSTLLRLLNARSPKETVAEQFSRWTKATVKGEKVELPGLVKRRAAEKALFLAP